MKMKGTPMPAARRTASRKTSLRAAIPARLDQLRATTREAVSSFERMFEKRVSRAIAMLGVPSSRDVRALSRQVAELQQSVDKLRRARARA